MMRRASTLMALVTLTAVAAGCGRGASTAVPQGVAGVLPQAMARSTRTEDLDLWAGASRKQVSPAVLKQEARQQAGDALVFSTKALATRSHPGLRPSAAGPVLTGVLRYPDFQGALIPVANATVHVEAKSGLGGAKEVAVALTDAQGRWTAQLPGELLGKSVAATVELGNQRWTIDKLRWALPPVSAVGAVNDLGEHTLAAGTQNAKAGLIHQVWNRALAAFERENIPTTGWWTSRITTRWPADGNYYSFGTVSLTDAEWWDVNGHEIGHAIFFAGFNSSSGGGQHKIDECYGADLAWSEGFASFFSAVISIDRADPDAKFEFMVPRRKPIRIENVPADVCSGHTNEWRVGAAMWDLYDSHADGSDEVAIAFSAIWGALVRTGTPGRMADVRDAFRRVAAASPAQVRPGLAAAFGQSGVPVTLQVAR
jgi:hypothetical protein